MKKDFNKLSRDILAQFSADNAYGAPPHALGEIYEEKVIMGDGVGLNTTLMLPGKACDPASAKGEGRFPVVLIRNPYIALAHSCLYRFYNLYGYAVVYQEVRGKGKSGGTFEAWDNERSDGIDTVHWIQAQPWYNGELYLVGSSYTAFVHMTMLDEIMDEVKGAVLRVFTPDFRSALYDHGMWHLDMITPWVVNMEYDFSDPEKFLEKYADVLDVRPFEAALDMVMGKTYPWHQGMIVSPEAEDDFWAKSHWGRMCHLPEKIKIPILFIDGWYDPFCPGMLYMWEHLSPAARQQCAMIIGPWVHDCVVQECCPYPMSDGEILGVDGSLGFLDWLNHVRFGTKPRLSEPGRIRYYMMGKGAWEWTEDFAGGLDKAEKTEKKLFYLEENKLIPAENCFCERESSAAALTLIYNPQKPDAFRGGEYFNNFMPGGIMDQARPFRRKGILNFISEAFAGDGEMIGEVRVHLHVSSDCEETPFIVRLDVADERGTWNVREGAMLMTRGERQADGSYILDFKLWSSAWEIKAGHRLRLDIASSNYPTYLPHGNVAEPWFAQTEMKVAHNTVYLCGDSYVEIPMRSEVKMHDS